MPNKIYRWKIIQMLLIGFVISSNMLAGFSLMTAAANGFNADHTHTTSVTNDVYQAVDTTINHTLNLSVGPSNSEFADGDGTQDNPYQITNADQLNEVRSYLDSHFIMLNDIDLDVVPYNQGPGWEPIDSFKGKLDGNGFEITGLFISRPNEMNVGLFGSTGYGAEIFNVKLENVNVTGNSNVGGLVGDNRGNIDGSYMGGEVTGAAFESVAIGGLVGWNSGGTITNSHANGKVTANEGFAASIGGLVGLNEGEISNSHAAGEVLGNYSVGGLVGDNEGGINNSYTSNEVSGDGELGGLVGWNFTNGTINNSYASGKVTGYDTVGGLVGRNAGSINYAYASGGVTGGSNVGGLVGYGTGKVTNSYWDIEASGQDQSAAGEGRTTEEMRQRATFVANWDFGEIWTMGEAGSYPCFRWELGNTGVEPFPWDGAGTENDPYMITTVDQLNEVRNHLNAYFELGGDIDLDVAPYNAGSGWEPIGTSSANFNGKLDGKGYKITGLYINRPAENEVGLFGVTSSMAGIDKVKLEAANVTGDSWVGGLVGWNDGGNISESSVAGEITGNQYVGGLVGANSWGIISDSYAGGEVKGSDHVGGLVGLNDGGNIYNSYASSEVTGAGDVGGLVGSNNSGTVTNSYWDQEVSGQGQSAAGEGKTTEEMRQQATFSGWDFDNTWVIEEGKIYPYFKWESGRAGAEIPLWAGTGTENDPYVITTVAHLNQVRDHLDAHFELGADINLDVAPYNKEAGWEPIMSFNGKLDGQGFKITGLYIDRSSEDTVGLFGYTCNASEIFNVKLEEVNITGKDNVGGLVGYNDGSIYYSSVSGKVQSDTNSGGLVGGNQGSINNSYSSGEVEGNDFLGGLVGGNNGGSINNSHSSSKVEGVDFIGGLVSINTGSINNSYASGDVTVSNSYVGGLVSSNYGGSISNSYASGKVTGYGYVGGLVSENLGGTVIKSYWDKDTTGRATSAGSKRSYGKSTTEMKQQATFSDWDFDNIWTIDEDVSYPYFRWTFNADLSDLALSDGILSPVFTAETINYEAKVRNAVSSVNVIATVADRGARLVINGAKAVSGVATTVPLDVGQNTINVVVTAPDGITTKTYTMGITRLAAARLDDDSSSSNEPDFQIINIPVETGSIGSATTVMQTPITRITEPSGRIRDEVTLTSERAREAARSIAEAGQTTARIVITDEKDRVAQIDVRIPKAATNELVNKHLNLEIFTENVRIIIPQQSLGTVEGELYFRLVPLKEEARRKEVENRARVEQMVRELAKEDKVDVISRPMTIETNMPNQPVTLILPLRDVALPEDAEERAAFLNELIIFIEHSDGEKRLVRGKMVEYKDAQLGIEFDVNKFSTFTILHMEGLEENNEETEIVEKTIHPAYIKGYEDGTFKPSYTVTRAEVAAMLAGNLGFADSEKVVHAPFSDVSAAHWAAGVIEFVKQHGLMQGDPTGKFNPNAAITRAEMATIAARYKQLGEAPVGSQSFSDVGVNHWAAGYIEAARQAGIVKGYEDGTYMPNGNLTRAEAVALINRLFKRGPLYGVTTPSFSDVKPAHWAFCEIEEAAQDHFFTVNAEGREYIEK